MVYTTAFLWFVIYFYAALLQEYGIQESQESLVESSLVKDKFGNTLNLIDAEDAELHRHISDSDTR